MRLEELLTCIKDYEAQYQLLILKAYRTAAKQHANAVRKSGEPYIIHPVAVACILAEMKADADTIAAGLLHDTIEDSSITKEEIAREFNPTIANLVDGVTKMKKYEFDNDKRRTDEENQKKITASLLQDIRILIIKLADRLHNMRTLEFQPRHKQIEKARETMEFFVPFAALIGEYTFKEELEDLSFKYLNPNEYAKMEAIIEEAKKVYYSEKESILEQVATSLNEDDVRFEVEEEFIGKYSLFKRLSVYPYIEDVHDLVKLKFILKDEEACYRLRDKVNGMFRQVPNKAKDYIYQPKPNMYRGLHTSVYGPSGRIYQFQMKTKNMHMINSYGLPAYWSLMSLQNAAEKMQNDVKTLQFYRQLENLVNEDSSTETFNKKVQDDILTQSVYVKTPTNEVLEMPMGSTPVDFAYRLQEDLGNYMVAAYVNGEKVPFDYKLSSGDQVTIEADKNLYGPYEDTFSKAHSEATKQKILSFRKGHTA